MRSGSDSVTVIISNKSSSSESKRKKRVSHQQPTQRQTTTTTTTTPRSTAPPSRVHIAFCESPDAIKLRLPGPSPPPPPRQNAVTTEEPVPSPPSLFRSPEKIWKILRCSSPAKRGSKQITSSRTCCPKNDKENNCGSSSPWMMVDKVQCCSSCCRGQSSGNNNNNSGLTLDMLKQHESMIHQTPDRGTPKFENDQLAQRVILQSKTDLQLAKERKAKAQQELDRVVVARTMKQDRINNIMAPNAEMTTPPFMITDDMKTWIELERQKALAAKWQRKKSEQWERVRAEQCRQAELERQRKLQTRSVGKEKHKKSRRSSRDATPATPKTAHLRARKFIHI